MKSKFLLVFLSLFISIILIVFPLGAQAKNNNSILIYQVNLTMPYEVYLKNKQEILDHIKKVNHSPGFIKAIIMSELDDSTESTKNDKNFNLVIDYYIDSYDSYRMYLKNYAFNLREELKKELKNNFSARRKLYQFSTTFYSIDKN